MPERFRLQTCPCAARYAAVRSPLASAMTPGVGMIPVNVHGGKPLIVSVGELPMFDGVLALLIVPEMAHEMPVPARMPKFAALASGETGGTTTALTLTVALPEIAPLVADDRVVERAGKIARREQTGIVDRSAAIDDGPDRIDDEHVIVDVLADCDELLRRVHRHEHRIRRHRDARERSARDDRPLRSPERLPTLARTVFVNVPEMRPAVKRPVCVIAPPLATTAHTWAR